MIKKNMLAITFLNEMLEDPYCFCRSHVRRYLVRFFEILKDSHDPLMRMSSCASRGDKKITKDPHHRQQEIASGPTVLFGIVFLPETFAVR